MCAFILQNEIIVFALFVYFKDKVFIRNVLLPLCEYVVWPFFHYLLCLSSKSLQRLVFGTDKERSLFKENPFQVLFLYKKTLKNIHKPLNYFKNDRKFFFDFSVTS